MRRLIFKIKIWFKTKQTIRKLHKAERKRLKKVKQMLLDDIIKAKVRQSVYNLGTVSVQFLVEGEKKETLSHMAINEPIVRNKSIIIE